MDFDRQDSGSFYGSYPNMAWHPNGREVFISYKGGIYGINVSNGKDRNIEFEAAVNRDVRNTIRFQVDIHQKPQDLIAGLKKHLAEFYLKRWVIFI